MHELRTEVGKAVRVLQSGGTILYPTDTIWGIGCDATDPDAVAKIFGIKQRSDAKSMLVLLDSENRLSAYVEQVPDIAWELLEVAADPMTIIYPGAKNLAKNLLAEDGSVGIRITADRFCRELISRFRKPIVSTSANISGHPSPSGFSEIEPEINNSVDYVVNWRQDDRSPAKPSSIIKLEVNGTLTIIRK